MKYNIHLDSGIWYNALRIDRIGEDLTQGEKEKIPDVYLYMRAIHSELEEIISNNPTIGNDDIADFLFESGFFSVNSKLKKCPISEELVIQMRLYFDI